MEELSRRSFLQTAVNSLLGLWAATVTVLSGYAGLRYVWPTEKTAGGSGEDKTSLPLSEVPEGSMKKIVIDGKPVGVLQVHGKLYALSLICTHLGCIVSWHSEEKHLICPCHAGIYDINGAVLGGPPPRPLPSYEVKQSGNTVVIG